MMLAAMVVTILMGMVHLFQVTWATQNTHARAREALMHDTRYLEDYAPRASRIVVGSTPFERSETNYKKSGVEGGQPVGVGGSYEFTATASDSTRNDSFGLQEVDVTATIQN